MITIYEDEQTRNDAITAARQGAGIAQEMSAFFPATARCLGDGDEKVERPDITLLRLKDMGARLTTENVKAHIDALIDLDGLANVWQAIHDGRNAVRGRLFRETFAPAKQAAKRGKTSKASGSTVCL